MTFIAALAQLTSALVQAASASGKPGELVKCMSRSFSNWKGNGGAADGQR